MNFGTHFTDFGLKEMPKIFYTKLGNSDHSSSIRLLLWLKSVVPTRRDAGLAKNACKFRDTFSVTL